MAMGSDDGGQRSSKSRTAKRQLSGGQSAVVGGGLVVGIATVVVVGVAGKLLSKLRKPNNSAKNNTPHISPTDSFNKLSHEENSDLQIHVKVNVPKNEVLINGKSCSDLDLQSVGTDENVEASPTSDGVDSLGSAHKEIHSVESSPRVAIGNKLSPELHSDDAGFEVIHGASKGEEDLSTANVIVLSELLNNALQHAKEESPSKHELLSNAKALEDGIVGVISRAFESYGDTSSDELTPTKVKLRISWETNRSSGSEEEVVDGPVWIVTENEQLMPNSTETEADGLTGERINLDAQVSEDEELGPVLVDTSSAPIEEQEGEFQDTTRTEVNETERGEDLQTAASSVQGNESTNPEVVPEGEFQDTTRTEVNETETREDLQTAASSVQGNESTNPEVVPEGEFQDATRTEVNETETREDLQTAASSVQGNESTNPEVVPKGEFQDTTRTEVNETETGEDLQTAASSVQGNESTNPEVVAEVQEEKIEHDKSVGVLLPQEESQEVISLVDEVVKNEETTSQGCDDVQKKETASQGCNDIQKHADGNGDGEVFVDVTSDLLRSAESSPSGIVAAEGANSGQVSTRIAEKDGMTVSMTKTETTSQDCDEVHNHTDQDSNDVQNHIDGNEEVEVSVEVNNLSRPTENFPNGITTVENENSVQVSDDNDTAKREGMTMAEIASQNCHDGHEQVNHKDCNNVTVNYNLLNGITAAKLEDSVEISTLIAEKDGMTVLMTSLVLPARSGEVTNITETVAAKEYTIVAGTRKAAVVRDEDFTSNTAGGLNQKVIKSWPGIRLWLEVSGLAVLVALISVLVWSIGARGTSFVPRLY
ncbi:unnamed protein product [Calypogeia fissa]